MKMYSVILGLKQNHMLLATSYNLVQSIRNQFENTSFSRAENPDLFSSRVKIHQF